MDNAIAIDNNHLTMNDTARTLSGDHESRVTDTGTSIVQPAVCKTLSAEGFDGMPDMHKGNGMPVVAIDGNKLCKNERAGGSGIGVSTAGVMYTETACDNKHHAVAVRIANTHANGHGVAEEATHTIDRASGQAVAIGFKPGQSGREDTGSLGAQPEQSPTIPRDPGGMGIGVAVGVDAYNQAVTGGASKPLGHSATDTDHIQVVLHHIVRRLTPVECERLQGFPDGWTRIPYRGKPADECPDSPRYKALGNSWATNCAEYILRRIVAAFMLDLVPEAAE